MASVVAVALDSSSLRVALDCAAMLCYGMLRMLCVAMLRDATLCVDTVSAVCVSWMPWAPTLEQHPVARPKAQLIATDCH